MVTVTVMDGGCYYYDETRLTGCPREPSNVSTTNASTVVARLTIEVAPYGSLKQMVEKNQESWWGGAA